MVNEWFRRAVVGLGGLEGWRVSEHPSGGLLVTQAGVEEVSVLLVVKSDGVEFFIDNTVTRICSGVFKPWLDSGVESVLTGLFILGSGL